MLVGVAAGGHVGGFRGLVLHLVQHGAPAHLVGIVGIVGVGGGGTVAQRHRGSGGAGRQRPQQRQRRPPPHPLLMAAAGGVGGGAPRHIQTAAKQLAVIGVQTVGDL